MLVSYLKVVIF